MTDVVPPFLHAVLAEATRLCPTRRTSSDGTLGDQAHQNEVSDHNPGVRGLVHAVDVSQSMPGAPYWDPRYGRFDAHAYGDLIARRIAAGTEHRVKYLVSHNYVTGKAKVWSLERPYWHDQDGDNHASHLHTSIVSEVFAEQSTAAYFATAAVPTPPPVIKPVPVPPPSTRTITWQGAAAMQTDLSMQLGTNGGGYDDLAGVDSANVHTVCVVGLDDPHALGWGTQSCPRVGVVAHTRPARIRVEGGHPGQLVTVRAVHD